MTQNKHNNLQLDITNSQILKTVMPISLAILIPQVNFITNNIFLGHYSSDNSSLAVAGITGVYYLIFAAIGFGLNNGLQALISRKAGENKPEEIGNLFNQAIWIGLLLAAVGIILTYTVTPIIFERVLHDQEISNKAIHFLHWRIWGLPFLYVYLLRNALLVGTNQSKYLIAGTLAETFTNIALDYALIFGHFGLPELGFQGAAIASVISEIIGLLVIFWIIHTKGIGKRFNLFENLRWNQKNNQEIFSISAPLMFQHAISIISWQYFFLLVEHHGFLALKISNVMRNVFGIFGVFNWAFASATNTMVSNIIGQGKQDQVSLLIKRLLIFSTGVSIVSVTILNLFPSVFLSIFGQGPAFIEAATPTLRVVTGAMLLMSVAIVYLNTVIATGNTKITFMIEAGAILLYCIFIYTVLETFNLPVEFGWMSEWLYWTCLLLPSLWYIKSGRWKTKSI